MSPGETAMRHCFLYGELGCGQSQPLRLKFFMAFYVRSYDLASLTRLDWDVLWLLLWGIGIWRVSPGETGMFHGFLYMEPGCG